MEQQVREEVFLDKDYFAASFKGQDLMNLPTFKKWKQYKDKNNQRVVKCPCCSGYEVFVEPTNHICSMCRNTYCQFCLHPCVRDEIQHDHESSCWQKFKGLVDIMIDWGKRNEWEEPSVYVKTSLIFIFGTHILYTIKYYQFFKGYKISENECVHWFFTILNLFVNIIYCVLYTNFYFAVFFTIFLPSIIFKCYFKFLMDNWLIVLECGVDELPITELTVSGRGYGGYS